MLHRVEQVLRVRLEGHDDGLGRSGVLHEASPACGHGLAEAVVVGGQQVDAGLGHGGLLGVVVRISCPSCAMGPMPSPRYQAKKPSSMLTTDR